MNELGQKLILVVAVVVLLVSETAPAQPTIAKDQIPEGINELVGYHIKMLYSADARQRYEALCALAKMGGKAAPAVPFVANMLGDKGEATIYMPQYRNPYSKSSVGGMAAGVLVVWCRGSHDVRGIRLEDTKPPPATSGEMVCRIVESVVPVLKVSPDKQVRQRAAYLLQYNVKKAVKRRSKIKTGPEKLSTEQIRKIREVMLEGWFTAIRDKNPYVRNYAAQGLGESGSPKAVDPLIEALKDSDKEVRRSAADGLGRLKAERAIGPLIAALGDQEGQVYWSVKNSLIGIRILAIRPLIATIPKAKSPIRERAAEALSQIGVRDHIHEADALKALQEALRHKDPLLRASAAKSLKSQANRSIGVLIAALKDKVPQVRLAAAWSLLYVHFDDRKQAIGPLIVLVEEDESAKVRAAAVRSLGHLGRENLQVAKVLLAAMKDESPAVRKNAAAVLRHQRGEEVVLALLRALEDSSRDVRRSTVWSLGYRREKQVVPALVKRLKDDDVIIRRRAAAALGNIRDRRAAGPLIDALSDSDNEMRWAAQRALYTITGQNFKWDQAKWRQWLETDRAKNKRPNSGD